MQLTKKIREKTDAPLADLPFGLRIRARAWTVDQTINVVRGNEGNEILLAHEAAHAIRDQTNAQMHHPAWHLCGLVGHAVRLFPRGLICTALDGNEINVGWLLATYGEGRPVETGVF